VKNFAKNHCSSNAFKTTLSRELSDYERVKRVYLLPREFSIDKGEMTPTLKIKRSVIDEKYWILRQGGLFDGE
jgi:long-subunit acyl-CoA synthetase (AMP-forming)